MFHLFGILLKNVWNNDIDIVIVIFFSRGRSCSVSGIWLFELALTLIIINRDRKKVIYGGKKRFVGDQKIKK